MHSTLETSLRRAAPAPWQPPSGNVLVAAVVALVLGLGGGIGAARAFSEPMGELRSQASVVQDAVTVTTVAPTAAKSICLSSASTTCVRIGGILGGTLPPTTTRGVRFGDGCPGGKTVCMDVKQLGMIAESGTVTVDISYGVN